MMRADAGRANVLILIEYSIVTLLLTAGLILGLVFLQTDSLALSGLVAAAAVLSFVLLHYQRSLRERLDALFQRRWRCAYAVGFMLALIVPFLLRGNTYVYHLLILSMLFAVLAVALNFQLGSANLPNFASGASYGIGAYTSALLMVNLHVGFWPSLVAAAFVAAAAGVLLGIPCMRTRDYYLALVTLAFAVVVHELVNNLQFTGGPGGIFGIPAPSIFGYSFREQPHIFGVQLPSQANFYYLALATLSFAVFLGQRIHHSRVGLAWNAIGADALAASCQGVNVVWYKVLAFAVDAFVAALAGTVYAAYTSYISPDDVTFLVSVTIMTMVIVGGMDNVFGVIAGAFILTILPEKFRLFADYRLLLYGVAVIGALLLRPQGILPRRVRRY